MADDKAVTKTALWEACGQRGRPDRLLGVWRTHVEAMRRTDNPDTLPTALPDHVRLLLSQSGENILRGLERTVTSIYKDLEKTFEARYHDEREALAIARAAFDAGSEEADHALARAGDQLTEFRQRNAELEARHSEDLARLAAAEARRVMSIEQHMRVSEELRAARTELDGLREALGQAKGRLQEQTERTAVLTRELEVEQRIRAHLGAKLELHGDIDSDVSQKPDQERLFQTSEAGRKARLRRSPQASTEVLAIHHRAQTSGEKVKQ